MNAERSRIRVASGEDGTLTYLIDAPPEALPPVRARDLDAAWECAREAAIAPGSRAGAGRLLRFAGRDGKLTDLALLDRDARCWAGAVDRAMGLHTRYGLSVFLRLLALIDLLSRVQSAGRQWTAGLFALRRDGASIDPVILRVAATAPLDGDARFDETGFRNLVGPRAAPEGNCA